MKRAWIVLGALALGGCAHRGEPPPSGASAGMEAPASAPAEAAAPASPKLAQGVGSAVVSPLGDFNLVRDDIPPILETARAAPYRLPAAHDCATLAAEIGALDAALGEGS